MLKQSELKNRLHGRTVLLVSSFLFLFLLSGCASLFNSVGRDSVVFMPENYAAKELTTEDIVALRTYAASLDEYISASASLVLGKYYLTYGDPTYGIFLINKHYQNPNIGEQMQLFGKLWKMEADLVEGKQSDALVIADNVTQMPKTHIFERTVSIFCNKESIYASAVVKGSEVCYNALMGISEEEVVVNDIPSFYDNDTGDISNMTYEEYLAMLNAEIEEDNISIVEIDNLSDVTLNVIADSSTGDIESGIMFALSAGNIPFKVNSLSVNEALALTDRDIAVTVDNAEVKAGDINTVFAIDWEQLIYEASLLHGVSEYDVVIVSASSRKMQLANYLELLYQGRGLEVVVLNYDSPSFQTSIQDTYEMNPDKSILNVGIGSEKELHKFLPIAKFVESDKTKESTLLVTESTGYLDRFPDFKDYYKNIYILTPINTMSNNGFVALNSSYQQFFGQSMNEGNMLGYDLVMYIKNMIEGYDMQFVDDYITNIQGFYENKPYRDVKMFFVNDKRQFNIVTPPSVSINTKERDIITEHRQTQGGNILLIDDTVQSFTEDVDVVDDSETQTDNDTDFEGGIGTIMIIE